MHMREGSEPDVHDQDAGLSLLGDVKGMLEQASGAAQCSAAIDVLC